MGLDVGAGIYPLLSLVVRYVQAPVATDQGYGYSTAIASLMLVPYSFASFAASRKADERRHHEPRAEADPTQSERTGPDRSGSVRLILLPRFDPGALGSARMRAPPPERTAHEQEDDVPQAPLPVDPIAEARRQWIAHGWSDAAEGMAAVTSIMRVHQLMLASVEAVLRPFQLTFARYEMLTLLGFSRDGALPMASATARLQVHPTSVTNTADRLAADGLIRREPHPTDGRSTLLVLTPAGRDLTDRATTALNEQVFSQPPVREEDLLALVRILARLRRDAGDFADAAPLPESLI